MVGQSTSNCRWRRGRTEQSNAPCSVRHKATRPPGHQPPGHQATRPPGHQAQANRPPGHQAQANRPPGHQAPMQAAHQATRPKMEQATRPTDSRATQHEDVQCATHAQHSQQLIDGVRVGLRQERQRPRPRATGRPPGQTGDTNRPCTRAPKRSGRSDARTHRPGVAPQARRFLGAVHLSPLTLRSQMSRLIPDTWRTCQAMHHWCNAPEPPVALAAVSKLIPDTWRPSTHRTGAHQDAAAEGNGGLVAAVGLEELAADDGKRPRSRKRSVGYLAIHP